MNADYAGTTTCYVLIDIEHWIHGDGTVMITVSDAFEGRVYASYTTQPGSPVTCFVRPRVGEPVSCGGSYSRFEDLIEKYFHIGQ
jgi:hypothetical protein